MTVVGEEIDTGLDHFGRIGNSGVRRAAAQRAGGVRPCGNVSS